MLPNAEQHTRREGSALHAEWALLLRSLLSLFLPLGVSSPAVPQTEHSRRQTRVVVIVVTLQLVSIPHGV